MSHLLLRHHLLTPLSCLLVTNYGYIQLKKVLIEEPTLAHVQTPVTVCGDIHGQFWDLEELFKRGSYPFQCCSHASSIGGIFSLHFLFAAPPSKPGFYGACTISLFGATRFPSP